MINHLPDLTIDEQLPDKDDRQAQLLLMSQPPATVEQDGRLPSTCRLPIDLFWKVSMFLMNFVGATRLSTPPGKASCGTAAPVITKVVAAVVKRRPLEEQS